MGIPIGWNIPRGDAKEKDVLRADITGQRSPIRRRLRPSRSPRSQSAFDTDFLVSASRYAPHAEPIARASHARTRLPPPPVPEVSRSAAHRNSESSRDPPSLQREDAGFRRARTTLDRWSGLLSGSNVEYEHPLPALTPGFAPASASRIAEEEALLQARQAAPSAFGLPEGTSYHRTSGARLTRSQSPRREWSSAWRSNGADAAEDEHESSENSAVIFHPLRRMGRRNIADGPLPASSLRESWSPATTVDGLGDRERSMSPYDEPLRWEIFHTTVVPDPVAPTAESSFASAAASASFSNSHPSSRAGSSNTSASSSQTHLTVPSRHSASANDQFMRACDTSDSDTTESDTEEEDDRPPQPDRSDRNDRLRNRYGSVILRRRSRPTFFSDEPPHRDSDRYSHLVMERARDASSYVRRFYSPGSGRLRSIRGVASRASRDRENQRESPRMEQLLDGMADGPAPASDDEVPPLVALSSAPLDQELREARSLLERLSRREDVSDDFWASVGLTRSFADRVESFNELEPF